jgi:hypothetical protein
MSSAGPTLCCTLVGTTITRRQRGLRLRQRLAELHPLAEMFGPHQARVERMPPPIAVFKTRTETALTWTDTRSGS